MPNNSVPYQMLALSVSSGIFNHTEEDPRIRGLPQWEVKLDTQTEMLGSVAGWPRLPALGILQKPKRLLI